MDYIDLAVHCPQKGRLIQSLTHSLTHLKDSRILQEICTFAIIRPPPQ